MQETTAQEILMVGASLSWSRATVPIPVLTVHLEGQLGSQPTLILAKVRPGVKRPPVNRVFMISRAGRMMGPILELPVGACLQRQRIRRIRFGFVGTPLKS
jgi:hypothetical protein